MEQFAHEKKACAFNDAPRCDAGHARDRAASCDAGRSLSYAIGCADGYAFNHNSNCAFSCVFESGFSCASNNAMKCQRDVEAVKVSRPGFSCASSNSSYDLQLFSAIDRRPFIFAALFLTAFALILLLASFPAVAYADALPETQTRAVTWLSTDQQPHFSENIQHEGLSYALVSAEIKEIDSQRGSVAAQRYTTVSCEPGNLDATYNAFSFLGDRRI